VRLSPTASTAMCLGSREYYLETVQDRLTEIYLGLLAMEDQ